MNDYNFGNFVCQLRESKHMTQAELANMLGVTPAAVSKWENGSSKPRVEVLFQLSDILGVRPDELMAGKFIPQENLDSAVVDRINERYNYLKKVESYNTAGVKIRRMLAWFIDWNIIGFSVLMLLSLTTEFIQEKMAEGYQIYSLLMLFIMLLFPICFILRDFIFGGRSVGKRITRLAILDKITGDPAKMGKRILRNLFFMIVQADAIVMLISGSTIGDRVAHTVVVPKSILEKPNEYDDRLIDIESINNYEAPKPVNKKKVAFIIIGAVVTFFCLVIAIALISLSTKKDTVEYKLAYEYLVESETFESLDVDESKIWMNSYYSQTYSSEGSTIRTIEIGFVVKFKSFKIVCHSNENGDLVICEECTEFE